MPGHTDKEVLVAILNHPRDLAAARDRHWYRIPVSAAQKWLTQPRAGSTRWPPKWLAFYQTKIFGPEAFAINYYAEVLSVRQAARSELFPDEPKNEKSSRQYYQLILGPLQKLAHPIPSRRWRRIVFIQTTWQKLTRAEEINDLYDESPLEDRLWTELKRTKLSAERQDFITANGNEYALDFAFYCETGKLDVETDGDRWHSNPARIPEDNRRDNDLETSGWKLLRFNTSQLHDKMTDYCLPTIATNVKKLGGISEGRIIPRDIQTDENKPTQLSLFDD